MITELLNQHTIGEAFQEAITLYGANDGDVAFADINGNNDLRIIPTGLINGSFENLLVGWRTTGDCRVIKKLSSLASTHGENMCIISTGLGSVNDSNSSINQTIKVTPNMKNLVFDYNVISEEPMEYVGSTFDDTFVVKQVVYESVNSSSWTAVDGIDFLGGDDTTYHTGWKTKELDLSSYVNTSITLTFWTYDKGDSIYDTATLIDNIHITN